MVPIVIATGVLAVVGICVVLVALWLKIEHVERHAGQRFDQMSHKLDQIRDEIRLYRGRPAIGDDPPPTPPEGGRGKRHLRVVPVITIGGLITSLIARIRAHPRGAFATAGTVVALGVAGLAWSLATPSVSVPPQVQMPANPTLAPSPSRSGRRLPATRSPSHRSSPSTDATSGNSATATSATPGTAETPGTVTAGSGQDGTPPAQPSSSPTPPAESSTPPSTSPPSSPPPSSRSRRGLCLTLNLVVLHLTIGCGT